MSRTGIIGKFVRGAAEAGSSFLAAEHKAKILAARDARLESYRTAEREDEQTYQTSERVAGETATAEQNRLDRDSRYDIAEQKAAAKIDSENRGHAKSKALIDYRAEKGIGTASKSTSDMRNLEAAGFKPGTPEYQQAMRDLMKSKSDDDEYQYNPTRAELSIKAEKYAEKKIGRKAGLFSSDSSDFKKFGGDREAARKHYINEYFELYGVDGASQQTNSITEQPPVEGARKAKDGNWYVYDPDRPGKYLRVTP